MHYVYGYFIVCVALVVWIGYSAEQVPVTDVGADVGSR